MYELITDTPLKQLVVQEAPSLLLSLLVAELFYKFHSFTLEFAAFLATWFVLEAATRWVSRVWRRALNRS